MNPNLSSSRNYFPTFSFLLSPFSFLLSPFSFLLSPFAERNNIMIIKQTDFAYLCLSCSAVEWAKTIRTMTDQLGLASIATLYQASNAIFDLFDKVLILDGGMQIYYGPVHDAKPFMEDLGFICQDGANVADFLTGVVVPTERKVRRDKKSTFPRNAAAVKAKYEMSPIFPIMQAESELYPYSKETRRNTLLFQRGMATDESRGLFDHNPSTASFYCQVRSCIIRQYQIVWGDKVTFIVKQAFTIIQALIAGSLFFDAADNSSGLFIKTGAIFFSLLYNSLLSMTEVTDSFNGRPIITKHQSFAFHHPAAFCIAQITADIPLVLFQVSTFSLILYFMVGLTMTASSFFTFWILLLSVTLVSISKFLETTMILVSTLSTYYISHGPSC
jgi:hypothetical protein